MINSIKAMIEVKKIGQNIQIARKRRKLTLTKLSANSTVSISVIRRIEDGDPSVGIGKVLSVLDVLGLLDGISQIASPELDREQTLKEIQELREKAKPKQKGKNLVRFT